MLGRVKEGVSLEQAQSNLNTIAQRLAHNYPKENTGIGIAIADFRELLNRSVQIPLLVLLGAVALLLLITCANLGSILLSRGIQRRPEMAVRLALGAKRSRIIRQLVSETMLIAVIGGALGVLLAFLIPYGQKTHSYTSRGLALVIFEQTTQSLPTSERLVSPTALLSWWREKEQVVLTLMIPFLVVMNFVMMQRPFERTLPEQDQLGEAFLFD
jgi:ABC-type antimicrobial peptide transport system permease subunit